MDTSHEPRDMLIEPQDMSIEPTDTSHEPRDRSDSRDLTRSALTGYPLAMKIETTVTLSDDLIEVLER